MSRGCTSHDCIIERPQGMGTNSTCRCADWRGQRHIRELRAENERLRTLLRDAADDIEYWGAYADEHFRGKWDLAGTIQRYRELAAEPVA